MDGSYSRIKDRRPTRASAGRSPLFPAASGASSAAAGGGSASSAQRGASGGADVPASARVRMAWRFLLTAMEDSSAAGTECPATDGIVHAELPRPTARQECPCFHTWKQDTERKALLVRGARQVGKTYSIRELGKTFHRFVEVNLEETDLPLTTSAQPSAFLSRVRAPFRFDPDIDWLPHLPDVSTSTFWHARCRSPPFAACSSSWYRSPILPPDSSRMVVRWSCEPSLRYSLAPAFMRPIPRLTRRNH